MPRYNFHDIKGKEVPKDLNDPVKEMLVEDLKCPEAVQFLDEFMRNKNCAEIQIYDKVSPKTVVIKTNYGMCEGYDLIKTVNTERFVVVGKKHIKNDSLEMQKPEWLLKQEAEKRNKKWMPQ